MENNEYKLPPIIDTATYTVGEFTKGYEKTGRTDNPQFASKRVLPGRQYKAGRSNIKNWQDYFDQNPHNLKTGVVWHVYIGSGDGEKQHIYEAMFQAPRPEETADTTQQPLADYQPQQPMYPQPSVSGLRNAELTQLIEEYKQRVAKKDNRIAELEAKIEQLSTRVLESGIAEASAKSELHSIRNSFDSEKQAIRDQHAREIEYLKKEHERMVAEARRETEATLNDQFEQEQQASNTEMIQTAMGVVAPIVQEGVTLLKDYIKVSLDERKMRNGGMIPTPQHYMNGVYPQYMQPQPMQPQQQHPIVVQPTEEFVP